MSALRRKFEDTFQEERAWRKLQNLRQGTRSVADFTSEFCQLAGQIRDWPEPVLIHFYKEALDPEIAQWGTELPPPVQPQEAFPTRTDQME
uniref:Uncharacterized protein n=1 Tax=Sphaerodactylus townsendi TaxID=933632 RepID=A0ACB8E6F4_9SAUR